MWRDRSVQTVSVLAGIAAGTLLTVALVTSDCSPFHESQLARGIAVEPYVPPIPPVAPPPPIVPDEPVVLAVPCGRQLELAQAALSRADATTETTVAALEALADAVPRVYSQPCFDSAAALVNYYARAYHKSKSLATAERLYLAYLTHFSDASDAADNQYFLAEARWSLAEAEKDAPRQADAWERAAMAFDAAVATGKVDAKKRKEAAYAAVLSWKNATNAMTAQAHEPATPPVPVPFPVRIQRLIAAFHTYGRFAGGDERTAMTFLEANTLRRYDHLDEAIPMFRDILEHHRDHETAEYAANLLLDSYNRLGRYADMNALATTLAADAKFLAGKPELASTVAQIKRRARGPHPEGYRP